MSVKRPELNHVYENKLGAVVKVVELRRGGQWTAEVVKHAKLKPGHRQFLRHWTPDFWTDVTPKETP